MSRFQYLLLYERYQFDIYHSIATFYNHMPFMLSSSIRRRSENFAPAVPAVSSIPFSRGCTQKPWVSTCQRELYQVSPVQVEHSNHKFITNNIAVLPFTPPWAQIFFPPEISLDRPVWLFIILFSLQTVCINQEWWDNLLITASMYLLLLPINFLHLCDDLWLRFSWQFRWQHVDHTMLWFFFLLRPIKLHKCT